jgi:hypothetical protein
LFFAWSPDLTPIGLNTQTADFAKEGAMTPNARRIAIAICIFIASAAKSDGRADNGRYANVAKGISTWIESLTDTSGVGCCATADGLRPQAIDWDMAGNHFRVKVAGWWIGVPDSAVIRGPNRLGYAVAWLERDWDIDTGEMTMRVRCFLPGAAS